MSACVRGRTVSTPGTGSLSVLRHSRADEEGRLHLSEVHRHRKGVTCFGVVESVPMKRGERREGQRRKSIQS